MRTRKFLSLVLSLIMVFTMFSPGVYGSVVDKQDEKTATENNRINSADIRDDHGLDVLYERTDGHREEALGVWINPLYDHELSAKELFPELYAKDSDLAYYIRREDDKAVSSDEIYTDNESAAAFLRSGFEDREGTIAVSLRTSDPDAEALMSTLSDLAMEHSGVPTQGDYIRWQLSGWECSMSGTVSGGVYTYTFTYTVIYYTDSSQEEIMNLEVERLLSSLNLSGKTEYQRIKGVYDYMTDNITYDQKNLNDESYKLKYTAYAALINKTAVCQGYALLLYRLMLELGVDCRVVTGLGYNSDGKGEDHAWNIIRIGDLYYNADSTWDASYHQAGYDYEYFLIGKNGFQDHKREDPYNTAEFEAEYPMADTDYDPSGYAFTGWIWAADYSEATARFVLDSDFSDVKDIKVTATVETVPADCITEGSSVCRVYLSASDSPDHREHQDEKTLVIPALGHDYVDPIYTWASDNSSVTAKAVCRHDSSHVITETVKTTYKETKAPTCEETGEGVYTAAFTNKRFTAQTKTVSIPATGHDYADPTYTWTSDNSSVTAKAICKHDSSHVETETVKTTYKVTKEATCEEAGEGVYTAAFTNKRFTTQTKTVSIPTLGHDYAEPTYTWASDNCSVTAKAVCKHDSSHVVTETVKTSYKVTKGATCEEAGTGLYTAEFKNETVKDLFKTQTKEVTIPATGHQYGTPSYTWADDLSKVTAEAVCEHDISHRVTETVNTTYKVMKEPTPEESGIGVYTAVFTNALFTTQTKEVILPALGDTYKFKGWTWAEDLKTATADYIRNGDETDIVSIKVNANEEKTPATCEKDGMIKYTVTVTSVESPDGQAHTDKKTVTIPATGHEYELTFWTWTEEKDAEGNITGYTKAAAAFTCKHDAAHTATVEDTDLAVNTVEPTFARQGSQTYTAEITGPDGKAYTDTKTIILPKNMVTRIYGVGRYDTALLMAEELKKIRGIDKFDAIVVASGSGYADALSGSYLAYVKQAPILLAGKSSKYVTPTAEYIKANISENGTVYILGGEAAVTKAFEDALGEAKSKVKRLAGADKQKTNLEVLKEAGVKNGEEILIATGNSFADCLGASSTGKPVILTRKAALTKEQKEYLTGKNFKAVILGGTEAVNEDIEANLKSLCSSVDRLKGQNRYETSVLVGKRFFKDPKEVILVYGGDYPDGLSAGSYGGYKKAPVILSSNTKNGKPAAKAYLQTTGSIKAGYVLGGPGLVSDETVAELFGMNSTGEIKVITK